MADCEGSLSIDVKPAEFYTVVFPNGGTLTVQDDGTANQTTTINGQ